MRDHPDSFPIPCRPRHEEEVNISCFTNGISDSFDAATSQLQQAYRRVQILYVTGIPDILQYLLTIASQPLHQQPWGGIFIDQLDDISMQQYKGFTNDVTTIAIRMSQTGIAIFWNMCFNFNL
jgi:hypothetical protein